MKGQIPESLRQVAFLLPHWQWIGLLILVLAGVVADRLVSALLPALVGRILKRRLDLDPAQRARALRPLGLLVMAALWGAGLAWLDLPERMDRALGIAIQAVAAIGAVWVAHRAVDVLASYLQRKAARSATRIDDLLIPLVRRSLKIFVTLVGGLFIAENLQVDIKTLLAGLGLGGLAVALAAKDTVENLFGSVTVLLDRPFQIGDRIVIDGIDGVVEQLGFRSTRIRTLYDSLVTIPNAKLVGATIDNLGRRRSRRIDCMIAIAYDTPPERIEAFCEGIRELVRGHPRTRKDEIYVHFENFAASSLDIRLYCFISTNDWGEELRERERLFLDIVRLAGRLGVEFAYPTQTLHLRRAPPPSTPPVPTVPGDVQGAIRLGREEADRIARTSAGTPERPASL